MNFKTLNADNPGNCIYGQITGDCQSERANAIMPKTFFNVIKPSMVPSLFEVPKTFSVQDMRKGNVFTALEKYLFMATEKTQMHIIDYLKGDAKRLTIK